VTRAAHAWALAVTRAACDKARNVGTPRMVSLATTALVILVPEAEALVKAFRDQYDPAAAAGMPAHVTVLYPFKTLEHIGADVMAVLRSLCSRHPGFRFSLGALQRFPTVLSLAPHPATPFKTLTRVVADRYPETPPYGGAFADILPHLTIAHVNDAHRLDQISDEFHRAARGKLPIHGYAEQVWLMAQQGGRWSPQCAFALARMQGP
jgi:2'-5' RNA ligase